MCAISENVQHSSPPWRPPLGHAPAKTRAGEYFDAVVVGQDVAEPALHHTLHGHPGAVIRNGQDYYWLLPVGSAETWPDSERARALPAGTSFLVPPRSANRWPGPHWRLPYQPGQYLTDAPLLAKALRLDIPHPQRGTARRGSRLLSRRLTLPEWTPPPGPRDTWVQVGEWWDCLAIPRRIADPAHRLFYDRAGAVIADENYLRFLLPLSSAAVLDRPLRQWWISPGDRVLVPPVYRRHPPGLHWHTPWGKGATFADPRELVAAVAEVNRMGGIR